MIDHLVFFLPSLFYTIYILRLVKREQEGCMWYVEMEYLVFELQVGRLEKKTDKHRRY